jgi:hypothetical protein
MPKKILLDLTTIHKKVLDEIELLSDAYISTFSEIGKVISGFSEELDKTFQRFLTQKTSWRKYDSGCYDLSYKPFTDFHQSEKFSIDVLYASFTVDGQISLVQENTDGKRKTLNHFSANWGFYYGKEDRPDKYFYFQLYRNAKRYKGAILSLKDYQTLIEKFSFSNFIMDQEHPENRNSHEFIQFGIEWKDIDKLQNFFDFFNNDLLGLFLSKIKE